MIKNAFGKEFLAVTPGIRPAWSMENKDDQQRVTTPADAIQNGSDYLVIGRPIRDAKDPVSAAVMTAEEIEAALTAEYRISNIEFRRTNNGEKRI
jgi:orotidine-5'-phosphate decarboxylase